MFFLQIVTCRKSTNYECSTIVIPIPYHPTHNHAFPPIFPQHPFNISNTREEPFYDAAGKAIANVNMMYQSGPFGYVVVNSLRSTVLEMPYGVENRLSILIVLPRKGEKLSTVMQLLQQVGIAAIRNDLHNSQLEYEDEDVEVYLPRFSIRSDFTLNSVLQAMGMATIFDSSRADLSGISSQAFLSRIIHKAQIDVNEEGTVASAVTCE